jgi:hypothetical protein
VYVKVFRSIFDGSLGDDPETRHIFMDLLALADAEGELDMTPEAIAAITRVPLERVKAALARLGSPDPLSRNPACEGKRLVPLDPDRSWGWRIVNYLRHRGIRDEKDRRRQNREAQARRRARLVSLGKPSSAQVSTDKPKQRQKQKQKQKQKDRGAVAPRARPTIEEVRAYCTERGNAVDPQAWMNHYEANGWRVGKVPMSDWRAAVRTWEKNGVAASTAAPSQRPNGPDPALAKARRDKEEWEREQGQKR